MSMVWYGMVEVCEGAPVAVGGWVLADRHDLAPCAVKHGQFAVKLVEVIKLSPIPMLS